MKGTYVGHEYPWTVPRFKLTVIQIVMAAHAALIATRQLDICKPSLVSQVSLDLEGMGLTTTKSLSAFCNIIICFARSPSTPFSCSEAICLISDLEGWNDLSVDPE